MCEATQFATFCTMMRSDFARPARLRTKEFCPEESLSDGVIARYGWTSEGTEVNG
jgi:hypothetical protein